MPSIDQLKQQGYKVPVENGLLVYQTQPGGTAERAGLKGLGANGSLGDILLSADGQKLSGLDDLYRLLDKKQIGDTVDFEVYRDGRTVTLPVKLLGSPSSTPARRGTQ